MAPTLRTTWRVSCGPRPPSHTCKASLDPSFHGPQTRVPPVTASFALSVYQVVVFQSCLVGVFAHSPLSLLTARTDGLKTMKKESGLSVRLLTVQVMPSSPNS